MEKETMQLIVIGAILFTAIVVICKIGYVNINKKKGWGEYSTKLVGITFIGAMALIAYVYDASNCSTSFALLGTLGGYFMGYRKKDKCKKKDTIKTQTVK
jgi:hypothetical protein